MKELSKPRQLPSLNDLYTNVELTAKQNDLNQILNAEPKPEWIKDHPFARGVRYIPISILEYLMTSIFIKWKREIKSSKIVANSVEVIIRVHYQDPITNEWDWQDGIGAAPIQTKAGAKAMDIDQVTHDAVMKASPAAASYAFKDAVENIGRLFGKDLNRKEFLPYVTLGNKIDLSKIDASLDMIGELQTLIVSAHMHHDEKDEWFERVAAGVTVDEYQTMKALLVGKQVSARDKIRNGETVSMGDINKAVKEIIQ